MRLYRGLTRPYRPDGVPGDRFSGTDFTDCPATALRYANGSRGVVVVVHVPDGDEPRPRISEELWLGMHAKRYMIWGKFDAFIIAMVPAKSLRERVRRAGLRDARDTDKAPL